jgi:hypothetical protein
MPDERAIARELLTALREIIRLAILTLGAIRDPDARYHRYARWGRSCLRGVALIGANLPVWVLVGTFSRRLAEMTSNVSPCGVQCLQVGLGGDGMDESLDDHAQQPPKAVLYAASRRGESPRCSAMSGSVNKASKRWQRMWARALLGSPAGGRLRPTPLLRCLKAISTRHRNR